MEELIIQQKVYDMILYGYPALEQFPKSQKFSLAQDIKKCMDSIMRYIIAANKKYTKKTTLQDLDIEVAALKVYIRMAFDLKYLPPKKYETWEKMVVEVGKMVGGWRKAMNQRPEEPAPEPDTTEYFCHNCNAKIEKKINDFSMKRFNMPLCYKCQRAHKKSEKEGAGNQ